MAEPASRDRPYRSRPPAQKYVVAQFEPINSELSQYGARRKEISVFLFCGTIVAVHPSAATAIAFIITNQAIYYYDVTPVIHFIANEYC